MIIRIRRKYLYPASVAVCFMSPFILEKELVSAQEVSEISEVETKDNASQLVTEEVESLSTIASEANLDSEALQDIQLRDGSSNESSIQPKYHSENVDLSNDGYDVEKPDDVLTAENQTVTIEYSSLHKAKLQAIVGYSNDQNDQINNYFSLYVRDDGTAGFELRSPKHGVNYLYERPAAVAGKRNGEMATNKLAFVADRENKRYKLFANGVKIIDQQVKNYVGLNDLEKLNSFTLGGVKRNKALAYGFTGTIQQYNAVGTALTDEELKKHTQVNDNKHLIFKANDETKANYFRIPTLYTLKNGRVLSSIDARHGGTHDSYSNISIGLAHSDDNGQTWSQPRLPLKFSDYENQAINWPRDAKGKEFRIKGSASFIDSALVQDKSSGRVHMLVDFMPAGIGNMNADKNDSGYKKINGNKYIKLKADNEEGYNYTIRENGLIYDDRTDKPTEFSVDGQYNLKKNNEPIMQEQYSVRVHSDKLEEYKNGNKVQSNIFYKDAPFKITPTNYIGVISSDDNGETWSDPKLLPPLLGLKHNAPYLGPGQGLQLSTNGRLIFTAYTQGKMTYIYSDDNGKTWGIKEASLPFSNATAEAQMVELKPGIIRTYMRTSTGKIGYMTSRDGGDTWSKVNYLDHIHNTKYGTQVTVVKLSKLVDGKPALVMATPNSTKGRRNGQLWLGLIDEETLSVDWKYSLNIDGEKFGFSYSGLTELANGDIGLYYEKYDSWSRNELHLQDVLTFEKFTIKQIKEG